MPRIPILDTIYRKFYYSFLTRQNPSWNKPLFDKDTAAERNYLPLLKSPDSRGGGKTQIEPKKSKKEDKTKSSKIRSSSSLNVYFLVISARK